MSGTDWLVVLAGVAAIAWINWYFFAGGQAGPAESATRSLKKEEL